MSIAWNIVNNTGEAFDFVANKVGSKIRKLDRRLVRFPSDALHLQIILDEEPHGKGYSVTLNLRIPSNVLHVSKESKSLVRALDEAVQALLLRLEKDKSRRRGEHLRRRESRTAVAGTPGLAASPFAEGAKPQTHTDVVAEVLEADHARLVRFVARQIDEYVIAGTVPRGAIEPGDVVDRVAERALGDPRAKPKRMDYPTWCSSLAFQEVRNAVRRYLEEAEWAIPVDLDAESAPDERSPDDLGPEEFVLNVLHDAIEPEDATLGDYVADPRAKPPDVTAADREMVEALRATARQWPKIDREVFEMYYLEGFGAEDIADALECPRKDVNRCLERIQNTLRRRLLQITNGVEP